MAAPLAIREIPAEERPRERLLRHGSATLANAELLAIIIGSGTRGASALELGQQLIATFGGVKAIAEATVKELCAIKGLGPAKALQVKAACQLGINATIETTPARPPVHTPSQAYPLAVQHLRDAKEERLIALLKDTKGCLIATETVAVGTLSEVLIHPRELFYLAIRHKAASLVIAHNHPSGDTTPSTQDLRLTRALVQAGTLMKIAVDDHLVIGGEGYTSLRERAPALF